MRHATVGGLSAELRINNVALEEFDDEEEAEQNTVTTKYVETVAGENFTVDVNFDVLVFPYAHNDIDVWVSLDGKRVSGVIAHPRVRPSARLDGIYERKHGQTYLRSFMFSDLKTGDGPVAPNLKEELKGLGTVIVELTRCVRVASRFLQDSIDFKPVGGDKLSEKALKGRAISNRASVGDRQKVHTSWTGAEFPYGKTPFATFTFKYRSHRDLQIEGIIERSPSPGPLEERDPATLTREELQELLRRRNADLENLANVKKEAVKRERAATIVADDEGNGEVLITGESSSKRRRTSDTAAIEIDLTDD